MTRGAASPLEVLERWEAHGATWRVLTLSESLTVVELCTCYGAPVDELRSSDPDLIRFLSELRLRAAAVAVVDRRTNGRNEHEEEQGGPHQRA